MKILKGITFFLLGIVCITVITAFTLDPQWEIISTTRIKVSDDTIFPYINTPKRWSEWTVWNKQNHPDLEVTHAGAESGVGAIQKWQDPEGNGTLEITQSNANESIQYNVTMDEGEFTMLGKISLESTEEGTNIVWKLSGDSGGNLISRLMMLAFKPMIQNDLDNGLSNLKSKLEV